MKKQLSLMFVILSLCLLVACGNTAETTSLTAVATASDLYSPAPIAESETAPASVTDTEVIPAPEEQEASLLTSETVYNADGTFNYRKSYGYDEAGDLLSEWTYDEDGNVLWRNEYSLDENGYRIRYDSYDGGGSINYTEVYTCDEQGRRLTEAYENAVGTFTDYTAYVYEGDSTLPSRIEYWTGDRMDSYVVCEYDEFERLITSTEYMADDTLLFRTQMVYDESGLLLETVEQNEEGEEISRVLFDYDTMGNRISESSFFNGISRGSTEYEYSDEGVLLWVRSVSADDVVESREQYIYDKYGNLTNIIYEDGSGVKQSETVYSYDINE